MLPLQSRSRRDNRGKKDIIGFFFPSWERARINVKQRRKKRTERLKYTYERREKEREGGREREKGGINRGKKGEREVGRNREWERRGIKRGQGGRDI